MPDSPSALIAGIQQKIARLAEKRDEAQAKCYALEARIEALEADLAERDSQLQQANLEIEFLTLSHRLADSPQALANARKTISRIIRKVDAAIALIKSDPADL
ncbi:MAG: hypothetical protein K2M31_02655 [Muribaculaceae bacterium]|nr:hypothetical protein [Muribaculaceae bacterium]